jgi:hypothetical protein
VVRVNQIGSTRDNADRKAKKVTAIADVDIGYSNQTSLPKAEEIGPRTELEIEDSAQR